MRHQKRDGILNMPGYKIPLKYDGLLYPLPVIYVSINDSVPCPFILDTGANLPMIIDSATAEQLELNVSKHDPLDSPVGPLRIANLQSVQFSGSDARNHLRFRGSPWAFVANLATIANTTCPERVAGIIGTSVMKGALALLDFDTQILTLTWHATLGTIPHVAWGALREFHGGYLADVTIAYGAKTKLLVDTGAMVSSLPSQTVSSLHISKATHSLHLTARGFVCQREVLVPSITVGGHTVRNFGATLVAEAMERFGPGSLGMDILSKFNVLLDFGRERLALLPRARATSHLTAKGITGISIGKTEDRVYITKVSEWSPANRVSLQPCDSLLAIDGRRVAHLPLVVAQRLLNGFAGTEASLLVQRGNDQPTTVRFRRLSEFDRPIKLCIDAGMVKRPDEPLTVLYVPPSSNMKGMLKPGDQILEIDGAATAPMEAETVFDTLTQPSEATEITVKRGDGNIMTVKIPR